MQRLSAPWKAGAWMLVLGGSWAPRMEIEEPERGPPPGSGNCGTPWPRMHLANVTAPGPGPEPVCADALTPPPPPQAARANAAAPATGTSSDLTLSMTTVVRAAV